MVIEEAASLEEEEEEDTVADATSIQASMNRPVGGCEGSCSNKMDANCLGFLVRCKSSV